MIYDIKHITAYSYDALVGSALCTMRLTPRESRGQMVRDSNIDIAPAPAWLQQRTDFFGNQVTVARITTPHRELQITATSRVEVRRDQQPHPDLTPGWEAIRRGIDTIRVLDARSPAHHIFPSPLIPLHEVVTNYAAQSFPPGQPVLAGAIDLMRRIHKDFRYVTGSTDTSTPLLTAFERRCGVCQDFAHIMIAGLRGIGLPAAYVSGYIRTIPPEGQPRLEGADASHAWVRVWCGTGAGWLGLDPTNAIQVNDDHVEIAIGRDYTDVAPMDGIILISGRQRLSVSVDVKPVQP